MKFSYKTFGKVYLPDHFVVGLINYSLISLVCINARLTPIAAKDLLKIK